MILLAVILLTYLCQTQNGCDVHDNARNGALVGEPIPNLAKLQQQEVDYTYYIRSFWQTSSCRRTVNFAYGTSLEDALL